MKTILLSESRMRMMRLHLFCLLLLTNLLALPIQAQFCPNGATVAGGNGFGSEPNQLALPRGVYVDGSGQIYVADEVNNRIQRWAPGASQGQTVAGGNGPGSAFDQLDQPTGVYVDGSGNVYIADFLNDRIQRWAPGASQGQTVAGAFGRGPRPDQLAFPYGVFLDGLGRIYVADFLNHRIQRFRPENTLGTTVAGRNIPVGTASFPGSTAGELDSPTGVYVDGSNNVYVADRNNHRIQRWAPGATEGVTVAGGNGPGSALNQLNNPEGVFVDGSGNVYVADSRNHRIQRWASGATEGVTVAGGNGPGSAPNQLDSPEGVFVDGSGRLYVADRENHRIQRFERVGPGTTISITQQPPASQSVCAGATVTASVSVSGQVIRYQWFKDNVLLADQTTATLSLPNTTTANSGRYRVVVTAACNSLTSTAFNLTVSPTPSVSLTNNGPLTCTRTVVALTASASPAGGTYSFTGPGANENTPSNQIFVVTPGLYTLDYTTLQGCQASTTTTVDQEAPPSLQVSNDGPLSCAKISVTITTTSQGAPIPQGTTYRWSGPDGSSRTTSSFTTATPGSYTLVVNFPNSCSAVYTTTVGSSSNTVTASLVSSGTLTCATPSVTLTASPTGQASYLFSGPGISQSGSANQAVVTAGGTYTVVVTGTNGCTASASTTVESSTNTVTASLATSGTLTCATPSVTLTASPVGAASYAFTGPGLNQSGSGNTVTVSGAGTYSVVVTGANGCTSSATTTVEYQANPSPSFTLVSPSVTTASVGQSFSQSFSVVGSGVVPYQFSRLSGNLPPGLNLSQDGLLSGTPSLSGSFTAVIQARDNAGCTAQTTYTLNVNCAGAAIVYVTQSGSGLQDGSSWSNALGGAALQQAVELAAGCGAQVWVAQGVYKPGGNANSDRRLSFSMRNGVSIYGGFQGTETALNQRPAINLQQPSSTTLSGDIGVIGNRSDNSFHVIDNGFELLLDNTAVLDGVVITGGNADQATIDVNDGSGGGLFNRGNNSPRLVNCLFIDNRAAYGGGIDNDFGSNPTLINCAFINNTASETGGGMLNYEESNPTLINCLFSNNTSVDAGGALSNLNECMPTLINCTFINNAASGRGGAVFGSNRSAPTLLNCVLFNNGGSNTIINQNGSILRANYSLFETGTTGYSGANNIITGVSPFVSQGSAMLNACSPAINAADPATTQATVGATDLAGDPRFFNSGRLDMGAIEYQNNPSSGFTLASPSVTTALTGQSFSQSFSVAGSGTPPYTFALAGGNLPASLSLSSDGVLSGSFTSAGVFTAVVEARDNRGCTAQATYTLTVSCEEVGVVYVSEAGGGTKDGSNWTNAMDGAALQQAIDVAAACGAQVWVARGVYKPGGNTNRSSSFSMRNNVTIYGGFQGTETALNQRPAINLQQPSSTTLSGDIGEVGNQADNSFHVIDNRPGLNLNNTALLDGVVITGGNADAGNGVFEDGIGGGLFNRNNNSPRLVNCLFIGNRAVYGGGIDNDFGSNPTLVNCAFVNNSASESGGAVYNSSSSKPTLINCAFLGNTTNGRGGAVFSFNNSAPTLINCSIQGSSAANGGSAIYTVDGTATLLNCVLFGNGAGNVFGNENSTVTATYSLFEQGVTGYVGANNLTTSVSPFAQSGSISLASCSPAIDAANPATTSATVGAVDLLGNPRFFNNGRLDIGAAEFQGNALSLTASTNQSVSPGSAVTLTASTGTDPLSTTYVWSTGQNGSTITVNPFSTTTYSVTATTGSCSVTASIQVAVIGEAALSILASSTVLCVGQTVSLTAVGCSPPNQVVWSTGQTGAVIQYTPTTTEMVSVSCVVVSGGAPRVATPQVDSTGSTEGTSGYIRPTAVQPRRVSSRPRLAELGKQ